MPITRPDGSGTRWVRRSGWDRAGAARVLAGPLTLLALALLAPQAFAQEVQSLEHEPSRAIENSLVQVDADTFALAYASNTDQGILKTFTIWSGGALPVALISFDVE